MFRTEKFFLLFLIGVFVCFVSSCEMNTASNEVDTFTQMYESYKLSDEVLNEAGLPVVRIQTEENKKILDKENWLSAKINISNAVDEKWNFDDTEVQIKGRGNTSWIYSNKKSYALKFVEKQQVCGMKKHKRWVLISNYFDNSFLKNSTAFYLSKALGMDYTVKGEFVNLVLNGNYVGLYWLGEAIKVDKNRVNIDEENDYLIEMDVYFDEDWKFKSSKKQLPYMISNDDYMTKEKLSSLKSWVKELELILYKKDFPYTDSTKTVIDNSYENYIDLESFAKFYLVNEIMRNGELIHPKSSYFTYKSDEKILKAGPVWDFDYAVGSTTTDIVLNKTIYYDALFNIADFKQQLNSLMQNLESDDVLNEIDNLNNQIYNSVQLDRQRWGTEKVNQVGQNFSTYDEYVQYLKDCVISRINYFKHNQF